MRALSKKSEQMGTSLFFGLSLLVLFLLPFIYSTAFSLPFELPKSLFFKTGTLLCLCFFAYSVKKKAPLRLPGRSYLVPLTLLLLWECVVAYAGLSPLTSFFGGYPRQQGVLTLVYYILFAFLFLQGYTQDVWNSIRRGGVMMTMLLGAMACFQQYFGSASLEAFLGRSMATMGQPTFLGLLFVLLFPFVLQSLFEEKPYKGWWWISFVSFVLLLLGSIFSGSKAAWIGEISIGAMFFFFFIKNSGSFFLKLSATVVSVSLLVFFLLAQWGPVKDTLVGTPFERFTIASTENIRSAESRLSLWKAVVPAIRERALMGYGQELIGEALSPYLTKHIYETEALSGIPDRTHNAFLDVLLTGGILGAFFWLVFLLYMFSAPVLYLFSSSKEKDVLQYSKVLTLTSVFVGFFCTTFFGFGTTTHFVFLWIIGALLLFHTNRTRVKEVHYSLLFKFCVAVLCFLGLWNLYVKGYGDVQFHGWSRSARAPISQLQEAVRYTQEPFYGAYLLHAYTHTPVAGEVMKEDMQMLQQRASAFSDIWVFSGVLAARWGDYERAEQYFLRAEKRAPVSYLLWQEWGKALLEQGQSALAVEKFRTLFALIPTYWQWDGKLGDHTYEEQEKYRIFFKENPTVRENFLHFARALFQNGAVEEALGYLAHGDQKNVDTLSTYGVIYGTTKDYPKAKYYFQRALEYNPENETLQTNLRLLTKECGC